MRILIAIAGLLIIGCSGPQSESISESTSSHAEGPNYEVAVRFINDYIDFVNDRSLEIGRLEWVKGRKDVSERFKSELDRIQTEAEEADPEYGLGFDPIFNAQEYPDKVKLAKTESNHVVVQGVGWVQFEIGLKLVEQGGKWLVDGAGVINMP